MARVCYATCKIVQSAWRSHSQGAASGSQLPGAFGIHKAQARASDGSWGHTCTLYLHRSMGQVTEVGPQCMPARLLWQVKWTADARAMREVQHMPGSAPPAVALTRHGTGCGTLTPSALWRGAGAGTKRDPEP